MSEPLAPAVTAEDVITQRAAGWPDWHPETYCHKCGRLNLKSWYTPSEFWNAAEIATDPIWCPQCFVAEHVRVTGRWTTWAVLPAAEHERLMELEARIDAALALHRTIDTYSGDPYCEHCSGSLLGSGPCPTVRALTGETP